MQSHGRIHSRNFAFQVRNISCAFNFRNERVHSHDVKTKTYSTLNTKLLTSFCFPFSNIKPLMFDSFSSPSNRFPGIHVAKDLENLFFFFFFLEALVWGPSWISEFFSCMINEINVCSSFSFSDRMVLKKIRTLVTLYYPILSYSFLVHSGH